MEGRCLIRGLYGAAAALLALGFAACGGSPVDVSDEPPDDSPTSGNVPPTIAAIGDQTVIRNTLTARTADVALHIQDPDDDSFTVTVTTDDESVIPATTLTCGLDPCLLSLTPSPDQTTSVNVEIAVSDGRGGLVETSFVVHVVPRLVTNPGDGDLGSLRDAVLNADVGDVIGFDTDAVFSVPRTITLSSPIELDRDLTIEGTGAANLIISGGESVRVFELSTSSIVDMSGLTVANGRADLGGGILIDGGSVVTLHAASVTGNRADRDGGGIVIGDGSVLTLRAASVTDNNAGQIGGGIHNLGTLLVLEETRISGNDAPRGGGIHNVDRLEIAGDSEIADNSSRQGGGLANFGELEIVEARIFDNAAVLSGGGIANFGEATISNSTVNGNTAGRGGGIDNVGTLLVRENSTLAGNSATAVGVNSGGGAIYNATVGEATISGSTIGGANPEDSNTAADAIGIIGGGVRNLGTFELMDGAIVSGNGAYAGGGIGNEGTMSIVASSVMHNTALFGGGIVNRGGVLNIQAVSHIDNNSALSEGGGIHALMSSSDITIDRSSVVANRANGNGGGLYISGGVLAVTGTSCLIVANVADANNNGNGRGGGIYRAAGDISGVASGRVCFNQPDDIAP